MEEFRVNAKDQMYQFWERNSLSIDLYNVDMYFQKMIYIIITQLKQSCVNVRKTIAIHRRCFMKRFLPLLVLLLNKIHHSRCCVFFTNNEIKV